MEAESSRGATRMRGAAPGRRGGHNKIWVAGGGSAQSSRASTPESQRWTRGGAFRGGRGTRGARGGPKKYPNATYRATTVGGGGEDQHTEGSDAEVEAKEQPEAEDEDTWDFNGFADPYDTDDVPGLEYMTLKTDAERQAYWEMLKIERDREFNRNVRDGLVDAPGVAKPLSEAIDIVGTCQQMCPLVHSVRRDRQNQISKLEMVAGTNIVDLRRAVKQYERGSGDRALPNEIRPGPVLEKTLDYLFRELLPKEGFLASHIFISDRSRAVRNDFTLQRLVDPCSIRCHDRCARFHILSLHLGRDIKTLDLQTEALLLSNTLTSLKEAYEDLMDKYRSPTELEFRVYHRLFLIREKRADQIVVAPDVASNQIFILASQFREEVRRASSPIGKKSKLIADEKCMGIFGQLAQAIRDNGNRIFTYLMACLFEYLFGKDTIEGMEELREGMTDQDIIYGNYEGLDERERAPSVEVVEEAGAEEETYDENEAEDESEEVTDDAPTTIAAPFPLLQSSPFGSTSPAMQPPSMKSAFANIKSAPSAFSVFGSQPAFPTSESTPAALLTPSSTSSTPALPTLSSLPATNGFLNQPSLPFPSSGSPSPFGQSARPAEGLGLTPPASSPFGGFSSSASVPNGFSGTSGSQPLPPSFPTSSSAPFGSVQPSIFSNTPKPPPASSLSLNPMAPSFTPQSSQAVNFASTPVNGISSIPSSSSPAPSPSISKPYTPPINTQTSFTSNSFTPPPLRKPSTPPPIVTDSFPPSGSEPLMSSPTVPPPLPRKQPISLPSTPTTALPSANSLRDFFKGSLKTSIPPASGELSPLIITSPTTSRPSSIHNFSYDETPKATDRTNPFEAVSPLKSKGKNKASSEDLDKQMKEDLLERAIGFHARGLLVREHFGRWKERSAEKVAWQKACRSSDAYREKIRSQAREGQASPSSERKRRLLPVNGRHGSDARKRVRRRVNSEYHRPHTDEELARRFKENHEEHQRRWAQGSFLQLIRDHVKLQQSPSEWQIWLSLNPDSDPTAIWLERKFDAPASGRWMGENVFSIPLKPSGAQFGLASPGVIIFECTPLEGITDDLERKYRLLDDCSRLRDIIKSLLENRHYVPSLLAVWWAEEENAQPASEFADMVQKLATEGTIGSFEILSITSQTKDLDFKFAECIGALSFDLEGRLVKGLTMKGVLRLFENILDPFIQEWLDNCSSRGSFNWVLYGRFLKVLIDLMRLVVRDSAKLLRIDAEDKIPSFELQDFVDSEAAFDNALSWLAGINIDIATGPISLDLQTQRDLGRGFPSLTFLDHIRSLVHRLVDAKSPKTQMFILKADIEPATAQFRAAVERYQAQLTQAMTMSVRRSPKRRSVSTEMSESSKRRRLSVSGSSSSIRSERSPTPCPAPMVNGRTSPSPANSISVSQSEPSLVTVAMLRSLTRNMKEKYGMEN
ncbi:SAC3 domain-containing protein [Armillaria novae-zelandiae]|uniref:SAC3 domain-containing protein n=1 Tax=Armillaria novae-zelandiae TaxID=153914 RepID=A0AA39T5G0_9AGAR|nr:SAC3 domain-containing protein [Armillaria novae-zelandiae]